VLWEDWLCYGQTRYSYGHTVSREHCAYCRVGTSCSWNGLDLIVTQRPVDRRELAQLLPRVLVILLVLQ
jgi:hypothetical protein